VWSVVCVLLLLLLCCCCCFSALLLLLLLLLLLQVSPVTAGLDDRHPYVRRTAVMGVLKIWHMNADVVDSQGMLQHVQQLLSQDSDAQVLGNCVTLLMQVQGVKRLSSNKLLVYTLINRIKVRSAADGFLHSPAADQPGGQGFAWPTVGWFCQAWHTPPALQLASAAQLDAGVLCLFVCLFAQELSDWSQCQVLELVAHYHPASDEEVTVRRNHTLQALAASVCRASQLDPLFTSQLNAYL
jgi:vesicle coat complex subunit